MKGEVEVGHQSRKVFLGSQSTRPPRVNCVIKWSSLVAVRMVGDGVQTPKRNFKKTSSMYKGQIANLYHCTFIEGPGIY